MKFSFFVVGILCLVSLTTYGISPVKASGNDILIQQLLQQLALLQAELRQLQGVSGFVFERNLTVGDTGTDVLELQKLLNQNTFTRVNVSGVGSPGQETVLFGGLTAAAVKRFQELYRNDILVPNGLTVGTGFVGTATRAKLNEISRGGISPFLPVLPATTTPRISRGGGGGGGGGSYPIEPNPIPAPLPTCTLAFTPASLLAGASTKMQVKTNNAVSASVDQGVGSVATGTSVEKTITPTQTARYTMTVKNSDGVSATCGADLTVVPPFSRVGLGAVTNKQCTFPLVAALPKQTYYWFDQEYAIINGESLRYDMAAPQVEGKYPAHFVVTRWWIPGSWRCHKNK